MVAIIISAILGSIIIFLLLSIINQQKDHDVKIKFLQNIIDDLIQMQKNQESKVTLSNNLIKNLHKARTDIDKSVFGLQKEIIEKLATNNLLD